jgi:DNA end-binding protein Ku
LSRATPAGPALGAANTARAATSSTCSRELDGAHEFQDRYEDPLRAVIEEKKKGLPVRPAAAVERNETVVDLMDALKRSLGAPSGQRAGRAPAAKPKAANRNKPAAGRKRVA